MTYYALVAYFDQAFEGKFDGLQKHLIDQGITNPFMGIKGSRPHLTLADFESDCLDQLIQDLDRALDQVVILDLDIEQVSSFLSTGLIFFGPLITQDLLALHQGIYQACGKYTVAGSYYLPGRWNPHITIGFGFDQETFNQVFNYCRLSFGPLETQIKSLALMEVVKEEETILEVKTHYKKTLKGARG